MSAKKVINLIFRNKFNNELHSHKMQETTFYEQLQSCKELDLRDSRGNHLNLAYILVGLTIGLLRKRDGCLSSIHRSIKNKNKALCSFLNIDKQRVVSRSHLPTILKKVCLVTFERLLFDNYGIQLNEGEKSWFAGDGKELRGSILKADKRGEAIVQLVRHEDQEVLAEGFYNGKKESEKPCLREVIKKSGATNQKITADALHFNPETTSLIAQSGGIFLIGLKGNQRELLADMEKDSTYLKTLNELVTIEKGHGRVEKRSYYHYDVSDEYFDERWLKSNFQSLFKVERHRLNLQSGKETNETSFYMSNGEYRKEEDYFTAIRKHWSVEANNHVRDVTLKEDALKTKKTEVSKLMSGLRTLVVSFLRRTKAKNLTAQLELFQDDFDALLTWLRKVNFL